VDHISGARSDWVGVGYADLSEAQSYEAMVEQVIVAAGVENARFWWFHGTIHL
jgi:hypothetical protein